MASLTLDRSQPAARPTLRRLATQLFFVLSAGYGLALSLFIIGRAALDTWRPVALINMVLHIPLAVSLVLLIAHLVFGGRRVALAHLFPALVLVLHYGAFYMPRPAPVPSDGQTFTLLTLNAWTFKPEQRDQIEAVVRSADADVFVMQDMVDLSAEDAIARFSDLYPYHVFYDAGERFDLLTLSRYPLRVSHTGGELPGFKRAEVDIDGTKVVVYNTHFISLRADWLDSPTVRAEQMNNLIALAAAETAPTVMAGDFNLSDWTAEYRQLAATFHDTYREVGWGVGFTYPDFRIRGTSFLDEIRKRLPPLTRIDYVFRNEGLRALDAYVWPEFAGSDHRALFARLAIVEN